MMKYIVKACLICWIIAASIYSTATAQDVSIKLYPNGVPNAKATPPKYIEYFSKYGNFMSVSDPALIPFFPEKGKANGTAVIICPGGAYLGVAASKEGYPTAKEFTKIGVTAFVLKYRLPNDSIMIDKTIGPWQDAQRAIQLVRQRSKEWGIDTAKVGIVGFSAGGHLASTVGTHFNIAVIPNPAHINLRPSFMMLIYPVITFGKFANAHSRLLLLGPHPTPEQIELYSNEKQVTAGTPITFLVQAEDDPAVPVQNSLMFYEELLKYKIKAEILLYPAGGHGFGIDNKTTKDFWFNSAANWLDANGFLSK